MISKKTNNKGQTIVEVLVVTAIIAMLLLGVLTLNINTQKTTTQSRKIAQATKYNTQAINWLRARRDKLGWELFLNIINEDSGAGGSLTYCLQNLPETELEFQNLANSECTDTNYIPNTSFIRELTLTISQDTVQANITTSWQEEETHQIQNNFKLTKW